MLFLYGLFAVYAALIALETHTITVEELPPGKCSVVFFFSFFSVYRFADLKIFKETNIKRKQ